jgi:ABC-2 type transport system ATP-binding protein
VLTAGTTALIEVRALCKRFGETVAVHDLDFAVERGMVLGLLGPNGAGKTTTINMLTTLLSIDSGTAEIGGFDVATQSFEVRQLIGLAGQRAAVDEKLTARENLRLFGRFYKIPRELLDRRVEELIDRFQMDEFADRQASTYSGGERRRLDVVAALVADPPALFLDEPTTGLDPRSRAVLWRAIEDLASDGAAIVLTTQYLEEADRLADQIVMIDRGSEVASGPPERLKRDLERDVLEIHLESPDDLDRALTLIGETPPLTVDSDAGRIGLPIGSGTRSSIEVLRRLDDGDVELADFQLRRPTLDDVFLTLTGPEEARS